MTVHVDRSLRLPESEYFAEPQAKSGIALHHTVCDSARTTLDIWRRDQAADGKPKRIATAFVIDRDGTIFEAFDPAAWAWQFGLPCRQDERIAFEKRFIGIEITNEGGLREHEGRVYAYDRVSKHFEKPASEALDCGTPYRGYRWFDRYEPEQLDALGRLVDDLCTRFAIPRVYPERPYLYYSDALRSFAGVIGHAMVRSDKSDPAPDPRLWQMLREMAGLEPTPVTPSAAAAAVPTPLTPIELDALFDWNARRLDRMHVAAGSLVKTLLMELERRNVHVRLATPRPTPTPWSTTCSRGTPPRWSGWPAGWASTASPIATSRCAMRKTLLFGLGLAVLAIVLLSAVAGDRRAIAQAHADAARLEAERDSLRAEVHDRERRQAALAIERGTHEAEARRLRADPRGGGSRPVRLLHDGVRPR
jgi:hypothetical protein